MLAWVASWPGQNVAWWPYVIPLFWTQFLPWPPMGWQLWWIDIRNSMAALVSGRRGFNSSVSEVMSSGLLLIENIRASWTDQQSSTWKNGSLHCIAHKISTLLYELTFLYICSCSELQWVINVYYLSDCTACWMPQNLICSGWVIACLE